MRKRAERDLPAVALRSQNVDGRDLHVMEKDLGEFRLAGHLAERPHLDAGTLHVDEDVGQSRVLLGRGVTPRQQRAPIRDPAVAGPDLLPINKVVVAFELRACA